MEMPPRLSAVALLLGLTTVIAAAAPAADSPKNRAAPSPRWSAFEPGAWVITRHTYRAVSFHADGVDYRRTLLLGPSDNGGLRYIDQKADQPTGPWSLVFEHADGREWYEGDAAQITDAGEKLIKIGETSLRCRGYDVRATDAYGITAGRRWLDVNSNIEILVERKLESKAKAGNIITHKSTLTTLRTANSKVRGRTIPVFEQHGVEETDGKIEKVYNSVIAPSVPGRTVLQHAWFGQNPDTNQPPNLTIEALDWGTDAQLLAQYHREHPSLQEQRQQADQERVARVQKMFRDAIAQAASKDEAARASAVGALAAWGEPSELKGEVIPALEKASADGSPLVRREAMIGLARCKVAGTAARIVKMMNDDPAGRPKYLSALAQTGDMAALDTLIAATRDEQPQLRMTAAQGLASIKADPARLALESLLDDADASVRVNSLLSLQKQADPRSLPAILKKLSDPSRNVRSYAAQAAAEIGDETAIEPLARLLSDPDEQVRASTCIWLSKLRVRDPRKIGDVILPLLKDPSARVRASAVLTCAGLREIRAVPRLFEIAKNPKNARDDSSMLGSAGDLAMFALGRIGDETARAALTKLSASSDPAIARAAAAQLDKPSATIK
jgi:HEAT repeat protein